MNKSAKLTIFAFSLLFLTVISLSLISAYHNTYLPYTSYEENDNVYPYFENHPTIVNSQTYSNNANSFNNVDYQGPIIEKDSYYNEDLLIKKSGRTQQSISFVTSERYHGSTYTQNQGSQSSINSNNQYMYLPQNPSVYDGGSSWRYKELYTYQNYGRDRYGSNYYYSPRYDSSGFYNWRY